MIELIGTIACSSVLFLIFRLFPKYRIDTTQAIVFNYFAAFATGALSSGQVPSISGLINADLLPWCLLSGALFITLFLVMGISSQLNGMGTTSVAVKMSLALSALAFLFIYKESVTALKIGGFILALTGVLMISLDKSNDGKAKNGLLLLVFLFVGSAGLDLVLNIVKVNYMGKYPDSHYTAFGFLAAGILGLTYLSVLLILKKKKFEWRNILAGVVLGIPNYFSIFFLIRAYSSTGWSNSTVLAVMNISIVSLAAVLGILIFKESTKPKKIIGLVTVACAIYCLTTT